MKRFAFSAVAVACGCFATTASAQSSVTLYGIVDFGIDYLSNVQTGQGPNGPRGHSAVLVEDGSTGGFQSSRWGILGTEDLGGGLSTIFRIESGFSVANGSITQGGLLFGRQVYVGLSSRQYGTLTLGRQYDVLSTYLGQFLSVTKWGGYMASHPGGDLDNTYSTRRINNAIKYISADYNGFTFGGLYSLSGVAGNPGRNQAYSVGANYAQGPLVLAVAYSNQRNPNFSYFGTNGGAATSVTGNNLGSAGSATSAESNPVVAGYASVSTLQTIAAGVSYTFGNATVAGTYSNLQLRGLGNTAASGPNPFGYKGNVTFNTGEVNLSYQFTPALYGGIAYMYMRNSGSADGPDGATYQQFNIGAVYSISKRTAFHVTAVYQHAKGTDSLSQPAVAMLSGQTPSATPNQIGVSIGMRHSF